MDQTLIRLRFDRRKIAKGKAQRREIKSATSTDRIRITKAKKSPACKASCTPTSVLTRTVFKTSRLSEFCSERELVNQTGHDIESWPLVILKELVDNSADACEEKGIVPEISIVVDDTGITVSDNGPGIEPDTVASILDYTTRVSSREAYISRRGARKGTR